MASPQSSEKLFSRMAIRSYDFDPNATTATDVGWVDMRDYENFAAVAMHSVGAGNFTSFIIVANDQSDGSGTDVTIKEHGLSSQPDAVGDNVVLECTAKEIVQEGETNSVRLRYVTARIALATGTDECVVTYVRAGAKRLTTGLTADVIS